VLDILNDLESMQGEAGPSKFLNTVVWEDPNAVDENAWYHPLSLAVLYGNAEIVSLLIAFGAVWNLDAVCAAMPQGSSTPEYSVEVLAVLNRTPVSCEIVEVLIEFGLNIKNKYSTAHQGDMLLYDFLCERGDYDIYDAEHAKPATILGFPGRVQTTARSES
jgi:hypothetical protein